MKKGNVELLEVNRGTQTRKLAILEPKHEIEEFGLLFFYFFVLFLE